jgi:serine/threonine-protein kinase HipA
MHVIDVCQLLNASPSFKYQQATLESLAKVVAFSRNKIATRQGLFRWLLFNVLIGNHDNHLKNISLLVSHQGIQLAPTYDLLSTAVYHSKLYPLHAASPWPEVDLAIALPGQARFSAVSRQGMLDAGRTLGLSVVMCEREIDTMAGQITRQMDAVIADVGASNQSLPLASAVYHAGELQLLRAIQYVVIAEMVARLNG